MFIRYAFLADSAFLDAAGKLTATGIFDVIRATNFPTVHRDMTLVAYIEGTVLEKGPHNLSVELRDDSANKLASFEQQISLGPTIIHSTLRSGIIVKLQDLPFQKPGQYEFVIFVNERFLGRVTFSVVKLHVKEVGET
jgi:hypothetical protein